MIFCDSAGKHLLNDVSLIGCPFIKDTVLNYIFSDKNGKKLTCSKFEICSDKNSLDFTIKMNPTLALCEQKGKDDLIGRQLWLRCT